MEDEDWHFDYPKIARESGFQLQQGRKGPIDWRQIGGIDVEKIIQNQNVDKLDSIIDHLAEVPLTPLLDSNILESGIAKYFQLCQLAIQYLVFCKRFLDESLTTMQQTIADLNAENLRCKKMQHENANDVLNLHKELQKLRSISAVVYPCSMCTKNFVSNEMLNTHIARKHSDVMQCDKRNEKQDYDRNLISTIKLELEIKQLKERLNDAEKVIRQQNLDMSKEIEEIKKSPRLQGYQSVEEKVTFSVKEKEEKTAKCVGVQNDRVATKTIGIQSNLSEDKEKNDIDMMESDKIRAIFEEINEKINRFDKQRQEDQKNREQTLKSFQNKLENVTEQLEAKQQHNLEVMNKFADKMSSQTSLNQDTNYGELKDMLSNAMVQIQTENKKQMDELIHSLDKTYQNKLEELLKKEDVVMEPKHSARNLTDNIEAIIQESKKVAQKISDRPLRVESSVKSHQIAKQFKEQTQPKIVKVITPSTSKAKIVVPDKHETVSYSEDSGSDSSYSRATSFSEDALDEDPKPVFKSNDRPIQPSRSTSKDKLQLKQVQDSARSSKNSDTKTNIVPPLKLKRSPESIAEMVIKMQNNRLKLIGVSPKAKQIPNVAMPQIVQELADARAAQKRQFSKFESTRKQIKILVDNVFKSRQKEKSAPTIVETSMPKQTKLQQSPTDLEVSESETADSYSYEAPHDKDSKPEIAIVHSNESVSRDKFKSKLERILSSPIHKVKKLSLQADSSSDIKVPIPTPRRRVMFDFPKKSVKEDEFSIPSDDETDF